MTGIFIAALACLAVQGPPLDPTSEDWDWLSEHRFIAFDSFMPLEFQGEAPVVFRTYRALYQDVPERYFRLVRGAEHSLSVVVIRPVGESVQQQLLRG